MLTIGVAIVAARLAEDRDMRVLVLEAGPEIEGLRVVDASGLPGELTANIHPAVIGTAERAADLIKASR